MKTRGFPGGTVVKNLPANAGDSRIVGSIFGLGRSHGGGNGNPLHSCLGNPMDRGNLRATVHGVAEEFYVTEWLSVCTHTHTHTHTHTCTQRWEGEAVHKRGDLKSLVESRRKASRPPYPDKLFLSWVRWEGRFTQDVSSCLAPTSPLFLLLP